MTKPDEHSRRDFLQGRAAVRVAAAKAQQLVESASELVTANMPTGPVAHVHASRRAMACEFAVQFHESDEGMQEEVLAALDLIEQIEDQLTIYRPHSEVIAINQTAAERPVEIGPELYSLLAVCQHLHRATDGAFDITSGPLSRTWGFLQRAGRLPSDEEIAAALEQVDANQVLLDEASRTVRFGKQGVEINFNSIGKGYALDRAAAVLDKAGQTDFLWHGGGSSVLAKGSNRGSRQACWTVGLRHPLHPERRLAEFHLRDRALGTAGGASQFFEHDGHRFSHILDPRTGWPGEGAYSSTVLAPTAALADGLATAFFVMEIKTVERFCHQHPDISAVLVCPASNEAGLTLHAFGLEEPDWTQLER